MPDVTRLLEAVAAGDRKAAPDLLPLVYDELRRLAAARMSQEAPGHTLDATALVHEAYLRLVGNSNSMAAGTSSPPRPRPCAASSSNPHAAIVLELYLPRDPPQTVGLAHHIERTGHLLRALNYEGEIVPTDPTAILNQPQEHWTLWLRR